MKVSVIGLGYIGLPTSAILASNKLYVTGVDINNDVIQTINKGKIHIVEPGLESLVRAAVKSSHLKASNCATKSDVFILAVPTPFIDDKKPNLSYLKSAVEIIAPVLEQGNIVIVESTVPVGTTERIAGWIQIERPDLLLPKYGQNDENFDIYIAHCPERVLPGNVLRELVENNRTVGGITSFCTKKTVEFYSLFVNGNILETDCRAAELSKLVENSFRDVNIAFANEISIICEKLCIDVWDVIRLANQHPRVNILSPGPGVGGHCIAVDPWFIVDSAPEESKLIHTARLVNDSKPKYVIQKVSEVAQSMDIDKSSLIIGCLGLSFKADIDDLRESPALEIVSELSVMGFNKLLIVEPNIQKLPNKIKSEYVELVNLESGLSNSHIILILVDHNSFKKIDITSLRGKMIIDTRGMLNKLDNC